MSKEGSKFAPNENDAENGSKVEESHPVGKLENNGEPHKLNAKGTFQPSQSSDVEPFAHFCSDNASVWKLYMDRAKIWDDELANVLNGDLDPLLIFAGLFSAILSAFLIETRKGLQEDLQDTTNTLLRILIQDQQNVTIVPIFSRFEPTITSRWINGLWFCSLMFSLLSALGASLAKGWVTQYSSTGFGTAWRDAASHRRRFNGMKRWRMKVVIQGLPILIHIAFFLFAIGLAILLYNDDIGIAGVVLALVIVIVLLYLSITVHTFYIPDSPFRTPVSNIIIWLIERYQTGHQSSPSPMSGTDNDSFKAQALVWLAKESADSEVIVEAVRAIAGLPAGPNVQDELYELSVVSILTRGLSAYGVEKGDTMDVLNAYLYAILRLVQVGPKPSETNSDPVSPVLASLVDVGGFLHLSRCKQFNLGLCEVALCINARIHLILNIHSNDTLFDTDIPVLLRSTTQSDIRRLLIEAHLLGTTRDGVIQQLTRPYLQEIKDPRTRQEGHKALVEKAKSDENILTSVSTFGIATLLAGLSGVSFNIRSQYLDKCLSLCRYKEFRKQLCGNGGGIKHLYDLLWGKDGVLREKTANILIQLVHYDDTWGALGSFAIEDKTLTSLKNSDENIHEALRDMVFKFIEYDQLRQHVITDALIAMIILNNSAAEGNPVFNLIKKFTIYSDVRSWFTTPDFVDMVVKRVRDNDLAIRLEAVAVIENLATHDYIVAQIITVDVVKVLIAMLGELGNVRTLGLSCIVKLANYDDIRMEYISTDVIQALITTLHICEYKSDEWNAVFGCIAELAMYNDVLVQQQTSVFEQVIISRLSNSDREVQECIVELAERDDIRIKLMTTNVLKALIAALNDTNASAQRLAFICITMLSKYDDIRSRLVPTDIMDTLKSMLNVNSSLVQEAVLDCIAQLAQYDHFCVQLMAINFVPELIAMLRVSNLDVPWAVVDCIARLTMYDNIRVQFMKNNIVQALITLGRDSKTALDSQNELYFRLQRAIFDCIAKLATYDEIRPELVTTDLVQSLNMALSDINTHVQVAGHDCIAELAQYDDIRTQIVAINLVQAVITTLSDGDSNVRWAMARYIKMLAKHDDIRVRLMETDIVQALITMLKDRNTQVQVSVNECIVELVQYDDTRMKFMNIEVVHALFETLSTDDHRIQQAAYISIVELAKYDEIRKQHLTINMMHAFIKSLQDDVYLIRRTTVFLIKKLAKYDDIRAQLIKMNVIQGLITMGHSQDERFNGWAIRYSHLLDTVLDCIVELAQFSDIRAQLITLGAVQSLNAMLSDRDSDVQRVTTLCIKTLATHDDIRVQLMTVDIVQVLFAMLNDKYSSVRTEILDCLVKLAQYDDIRMQFVTQDVMQALVITPTQNNYESWAWRASFSCLTKLMKHDSIRVQLRTADLGKLLITRLNTWLSTRIIYHDEHAEVQRLIVDFILELTKYNDTSTENVISGIIQALIRASMNTDVTTQQATAVKCISELAKHDDIRMQLITANISEELMVALSLGYSGLQREASLCIEELAKHDNIGANCVPMFLTKLSSNNGAVRRAMIASVVELAKHDHARAQLMTIDVVQTVITRLSDSETNTRLSVVNSVLELAKYDNTSLHLVTEELMNIILNIDNDHDLQVGIKLLVELTKCNDIHAPRSTHVIFNFIIDELKTTKSPELQRVYGKAIIVLLDIAVMPDISDVSRSVTTLLADKDPSIVRIILPGLSHLVKQPSWRRHLCQSFQWKYLAELLDRHDTRLDALQALQKLAQYDDLVDVMKHDFRLVSSLLDMLKSQTEDIERWTVAAEGLLVLGLF